VRPRPEVGADSGGGEVAALPLGLVAASAAAAASLVAASAAAAASSKDSVGGPLDARGGNSSPSPSAAQVKVKSEPGTQPVAPIMAPSSVRDQIWLDADQSLLAHVVGNEDSADADDRKWPEGVTFGSRLVIYAAPDDADEDNSWVSQARPMLDVLPGARLAPIYGKSANRARYALKNKGRL
jgi:hypothetical protein